MYKHFYIQDSSDINVENAQLDYNLKYEHQNKGENYNHGQSYHKNENEKCTIKNEHFKNFENIHDNGNDSRHENALKKKSEDYEKLVDGFCNRKNQLYAFLYYNLLNWFLEITLNTIYCIVGIYLQAVSPLI